MQNMPVWLMLLCNKHKHLHLVITSWEDFRFLGSLCLQWSCTTFKELCAPRCRDHTDFFVAPSSCSKAHTEKGTHKTWTEQNCVMHEKCDPSHFFDLKLLAKNQFLAHQFSMHDLLGFLEKKKIFLKRWILSFQNYTPYIFSFAWGLDSLPSVLPLNCDPTFT